MPSNGTNGVNKKRLNVICHGLMVFWFNKKKEEVIVRIPRVPGHSYGAGNLFTEQAFGPGKRKLGTISLTGVDPGDCSTLNADQHLVLDRKYGALRADLGKLHRSIELPLPNDILGFRFATAPKGGFFTGKAQKKYKVNPSMLPILHVLTYESFSKPRLEENKKALWEGQTEGIQNLHIFGEPVFPGEEHWHYLTGSFQADLDLQIKHGMEDHTHKAEGSSKDGLSWDDMKSLQERQPSVLLGGPPPNCMSCFVV